jgi:hypothetical protein
MRILSVIFFAVSFLAAGDTTSVLSLLPEKKIVPAFTASGTEHRISYNKQLARGAFIGSMGGIFPVATVRYKEAECQISVASSIYTTLHNAGSKFKVTDVNFYVDLFFDIPVAVETIIRAGWGHTSHHLADDALLPGVTAINYARDYYALFGIQKLSAIDGFAYGGLYWTYSFLINKNIRRKLLPEIGAEGILLPLTNTFSFYGAVDMKFRGEMNYGSTQSYQAGIKSQNENMRAVRVAYTYRTGVEERGQFYTARDTFHSIGIFFDF